MKVLLTSLPMARLPVHLGAGSRGYRVSRGYRGAGSSAGRYRGLLRSSAVTELLV
jgi:hypothetical protein